MAQDINRLKVVLAEQKRTNKWLAEQLGKDPASVSKWCTNASQPSFRDFGRNRQKPQCGCEGFALVNKRAINKQQNHETTNQHRRTS